MGIPWGKPKVVPPPPPILQRMVLYVQTEALARGMSTYMLVAVAGTLLIAVVGALLLLQDTLAPKAKPEMKRRRSTISSKMTNRVDDDKSGGRRKAVRGGVARSLVDNLERQRQEQAKVKDDQEKAWIKSAIRKNEMFSKLKDVELDLAVNEARAQLADPNETIIIQDAIEETFYVVGSGTFVVTKDERAVTTYTAGASFGELALLYNTPRQATVTCREEGWLWAIEGQAFREVMQQLGTRELAARAAFLKDLPLLASLTPAQRFGLAEKLEERSYNDMQLVCEVDEVADCVFIVRSGQVACKRTDGTLVTMLNPGDFFGESALEHHDAVRLLDCVASGRLVLLRLSAKVFREQFGGLSYGIDHQFRRRVLEGVMIDKTRLFDKLSLEAQEDFIAHLKEVRNELRTHLVPTRTRPLARPWCLCC